MTSLSILSVFLLGSALMGLMPGAVFAQTPPSGAAQADAEEGIPKVSWGGACEQGYRPLPATACDKLGCYAPDCLGGWGLRPRRTYKLVYDGDPVCKVIVKTLNDTLRMDPKEAIRRVTHPMPFPDKIEKLGWKDVKFYRSQNPLFSDSIFTQWNYLHGNNVNTESRFGVGAGPLEYWQILPYKNDGVDRLVTIHTNPSDRYRTFIEAPYRVNEWDIPADKLKMEDWSYYKTYLPYESANSDKIDMGVLRYIRSAGYSKLPRAIQKEGTFWTEFPRFYGSMNFAQIQGRYYTILISSAPYDLMVVADAARPPGDDLCYIESSITHKVKLSPGRQY